MKLEYWGCSNTGYVRSHNEDAILMRDCVDSGLFLVADGIGGGEHGEAASRQLRVGYGRWWRERFLREKDAMDFRQAVGSLRAALLEINRDLTARYGEMRTGSTLALLFLFRGNCACLSSGDSRIYRIRGLSLRQISTDDVYRARFGTADAWQNGQLTGAVGIRKRVEFTIWTDTVRKGDRFFLCSDGVYRCAGNQAPVAAAGACMLIGTLIGTPAGMPLVCRLVRQLVCRWNCRLVR